MTTATDDWIAAARTVVLVEGVGDQFALRTLADRRGRDLGTEGDLTSFRTFQQQPAQQRKSDEARLRRFMGTRGGRKIHYASVLVRSLDLSCMPAPLDNLLASV